jgi:hypothetical protein
MEPKNQGNKEITVSFANAVAKENNRGSVSAAQKAGRKSKASPPRTRAITRARAKGKGKAIEAVGDTEVIDNGGTGTGEALDGKRGRKRKAVDVDAASGPSKPVSGPRKLRKRA